MSQYEYGYYCEGWRVQEGMDGIERVYAKAACDLVSSFIIRAEILMPVLIQYKTICRRSYLTRITHFQGLTTVYTTTNKHLQHQYHNNAMPIPCHTIPYHNITYITCLNKYPHYPLLIVISNTTQLLVITSIYLKVIIENEACRLFL